MHLRICNQHCSTAIWRMSAVRYAPQIYLSTTLAVQVPAMVEYAYVLKQAYYCCRHRTGSIVIGAIDLVAAVIGIFIFAAILPEKPLFHVSGLPSVGSQLRVPVILFVVAIIFGAVAAITLLVGIFKRSTNCLLAYLVLSGIAIILCWIAWGMALSHIQWYIILITLIFLVLSIYHWVIVFSYFIVLTASEDETSDVSDLSSHGFLLRVDL